MKKFYSLWQNKYLNKKKLINLIDVIIKDCSLNEYDAKNKTVKRLWIKINIFKEKHKIIETPSNI